MRFRRGAFRRRCCATAYDFVVMKKTARTALRDLGGLMTPRVLGIFVMTAAIFPGMVLVTRAQQPSRQGPSSQTGQIVEADFDAHRPPLAFRAEWKRESANAPQRPLVQGDLLNQSLQLQIYGGRRESAPTTCPTAPASGGCLFGIGVIWVQHSKEPTYAWTGLCDTQCAVTVSDKNNDIDMTGLSRIRWRSMQAGFHLLRPIVKLANGTWLAGDHVDGASTDWKESDIVVADMRWRTLDVTRVIEGRDGKWVDNPDLSRVVEVGFTDLTEGAGHGRGGSSRVAWIEVYGKPIPRSASR
jgi:hypothetical protein